VAISAQASPPAGPPAMPVPQLAELRSSRSTATLVQRSRRLKRLVPAPDRVEETVVQLSPKRGRAIVTGLFLLLLPLVVMLAWHLHLAISARQHLQLAIAEADRLDPGWRMDELPKVWRPIPDALNAIPRIRAASGLIPSQWPSIETENLIRQEVRPELRLDHNQAQALGKDLATAREALQVARQLA